MIPFLLAAYRDEALFAECDHSCDAMLSNHVAKRASRAQGRAFILAVSKIFPRESFAALAASIRRDQLAGHFATIFGVVCKELNIDRDSAVRLFLFIALRGLISAAVRLGIVGPMKGQSIQRQVCTYAEGLVEPAREAGIDAAAQTAPLLDLLQGTQDRLYSRLFQS